MEIVGTIISAQDEPNKSGEGESFKVRFRASNGKDWGPFTLFHDGLKEKATELKGKVNSTKLTVEKPEGSRFWDLKAVEAASPDEPQTPAYHNGRDDAIAHAVAIKEIGEDWRADKLADGDTLVVAYVNWLREQMQVAPKRPAILDHPSAPKHSEAPIYKDKDGDDVSKAILSQIDALKKMLGITDDDNFTNAIRSRFGDEALQIKDLSKNEAGDWITELQKEVK